MGREDSFLAVDPGLHKMGAAYFRGGMLELAWLIRTSSDKKDAESWVQMARTFARAAADCYAPALVYEMMQRDKRTTGAKIDAMFQLCGVIGACAAQVSPHYTVGYTPSEWTKNRPKAANQTKIIRALGDKEAHVLLATCSTGAFSHRVIPTLGIDGVYEKCRQGSDWNASHVIDAIGVGLYHMRRLR